jgi:hypothetical protein
MALGCEKHTVYIYDRGGITRIGVVELPTRVRWNRVRDDISNANVVVRNPGTECCELLSRVEPGRHEMVIYRAGVREWEGPITRMAFHTDYVEIEARDVMHYVYRTIARAAYNNAYPNIDYTTERMRDMLTAELARKEALSPPINVLPYLAISTHAETSKTSRSTQAYQLTVWEDIDSMAAKAGLDYSVVGRRIYANDVHDVVGRTQIMTEADFLGDVIITAYGLELATYSAVTDSEGHWGAFGGVDSYYGEWELLHSSYGEAESAATDEAQTVVELTEQAKRNLAGRYPTPLVVRVPDSSALNPATTSILFEQLVPGVRIPLRATLTCRQITQEQKLDRVRVEEDSRGETVTVTLSPAPGVLPEEWTGSDSAGA